ncbi:protein argonaute-1-like [Rhipicephalus microplus]|uniref:protein argonaute-1-like n=1 Tax=Rhipicephalus microplus TaxID=6941 RepID=UPI003F6BC930
MSSVGAASAAQLSRGSRIEMPPDYAVILPPLPNGYPELPCLLVGPEKRKAFLPFALCDIEPGQKCRKRLTNAQTAKLIRASGTSAPERESEIKALVWNANSRMDPYKK